MSYNIGDVVKLTEDVSGYEKGTKGIITKECGEGYHVKCPDGEFIHVEPYVLEKVDSREEEGYGVTFDEASPILSIEKLGILGRVNVGLHSGNPVPNTDGKAIYLPQIISFIKYKRRKGENAGNDPNLTLYVGSLFHEAAHIRYGSFLIDISDYVQQFESPEIMRTILNIVEDVRVEYLFKKEFIDDPKRVKPLVQTERYLVKIMDTDNIDSDFTRLIVMLTQKAISGYTHGELNKKTRGEKKFLKKKYKSPEGKRSYAELFVELLDEVEQVKRADATVFDSIEIAERIYRKLHDAFGDELSEAEMPETMTQHSFDTGRIRLERKEDITSEDKRSKFRKEYEKQKKRMDVKQKDIEKEIERMREEGELPEGYEPPKPKSPKNKKGRNVGDYVKWLINKLKGMRGDKQKQEDNKQSQISGFSGADFDPLKEFVRRKLEERGYSPQKAEEIANNLNPE
ncbi:hypothetical protein D6745_01185 [Candidatus Woesearchaeota archaeon]|nr:MAG: hypothetical protein D6745_01185 [Candidatus Woesearchaeota archaeon]